MLGFVWKGCVRLLTSKANAGESRGGEGGARSATTGDIVRLVQSNLASEEREAAEIQVHRITEGIYSVYLKCHGEAEGEAFMLSTTDQKWDSKGPS
jgi:hypothetical protein